MFYKWNEVSLLMLVKTQIILGLVWLLELFSLHIPKNVSLPKVSPYTYTDFYLVKDSRGPMFRFLVLFLIIAPSLPIFCLTNSNCLSPPEISVFSIQQNGGFCLAEFSALHLIVFSYLMFLLLGNFSDHQYQFL